MSGAPGSATVVGAVASEPRPGAVFTSATSDAGAATDFWSLLVQAETSDQLCQAWLGILCQWIPGTQAGLLLLHQAADDYAPAAVWPDPSREMGYLAGVAQQSLVARSGVVVEESTGLAQCAYPLLGAHETFGVVVLHVVSRGAGSMRDALRILHWGAGWLVGLFDKRRLIEREQRLQQSALLQDLLLGALAEAGPEEAGRWIVNRLTQALPCRQAVLGLTDRQGRVKIHSVSGTSQFDPRTNLLSGAREALAECIVSGQPCSHPPAQHSGAAALLSTSALADHTLEAQATAAMAVPLVHQGQAVGALLLDFDRALDDGTRQFVGTLALALAPGMALQRQAHRGLLTHTGVRSAAAWRTLVGPRHPGRKLLAVTGLLALALAAGIDLPYRVHAPASIEGRVQRAAVAPFEGFIAEASVRAGDRVHAGDVLARMDDRDLRLEAGKAAADVELAERRMREAMSRTDAVALRIAQAELAQTQAASGLVQERLSRVLIVAPFDARVIKGDLTQQLGAPVEQGRVLFELAPLDAWRVVLKVDERDIARIGVGQAGELVLAGLPGVQMALRVAKISPVALAEDGHNSFRVEAELADASAAGAGGHAGAGAGADAGAHSPGTTGAKSAARIQPGMEGAGKLQVGAHSLLWISLHRLQDWARYTAWTVGL